jgi:hypothetical protein
MDATIRKRFDDALHDAIKTMSYNGLSLVAHQRKMKVKFDDQLCAELSFTYSSKTSSVYMGAPVFAGRTHDVIMATEPQARPANFTADSMLLTTLSEERKEFGNLHGQIEIYANMDFAKTCEQLVDRVEKSHLKRLHNFLSLSENTIADIAEYPGNYKYPVMTIAVIMREHGIDSEQLLPLVKSFKGHRYLCTPPIIAEAQAILHSS